MKIIGTKLKMSQIWKEEKVIPVTPIKVTDEKSDLSAVKEGSLVKVSGITKGHGFQGVVKRHSFRGGPKTHGQKNRLRAPGSIGSTAPQRVVPGRKMAGHMGVVRVTIKNLEIAKVDSENKMIFVKGGVPGTIKGRLEIVSLD